MGTTVLDNSLVAPQSIQAGDAEHASWLAAAIDQNLPVALWRTPGASAPHGLIALAAPLHLAEVDFRRPARGFVFAPFSDAAPTLFLPAHVVLAPGAATLAPDLPAPLRPAADRLLHALASPPPAPPRWYAAAQGADRALGEAEFRGLVDDAVAFIRTQRIAKVVVSRTAPVALQPGFRPSALFDALCRRYPDAFVSLVAVPGVGTWIGASPELLLHVEGTRLTTMALAGTQASDGRPLDAVRWGAKEQIEQAMVADYIRTVFAEAGVPDVVERGPHTAAAGSVVHLQTIFEARLPGPSPLEAANAVLARLHPTSAVCGMPRPQALQFIEAREGYDRGFYSGYLGPVHWDGRSTLYVNLRCLQVRAATASLYVGAGVTAESDPAAEWRETEMKARTVLDALQDAQAGAPVPAALS
jgi:isochorismate synthase